MATYRLDFARSARLWSIWVALAMLAGCSFEAGLTGFECSTENEVRPNGEVCRDGYWRIDDGMPRPPDVLDATPTDTRDTSTPPDSAQPDVPDTTPALPDAVDDVRPDAHADADLDAHTDADADAHTDLDARTDADAHADADAHTDADAIDVPDVTPPGCQAPFILCGGECVDLAARNRDEGPCDTGELGVCAQGRLVCLQDAVVCTRIRDPDAQEHCGETGTGNGLDDNCNGEVDEGCGECENGKTQPCYDGPAGTQNVGICHGGTQTCVGGHWGTCEEQVLPGEQQCNGKDNDCDGHPDREGLTLNIYYPDADNDGFGDPRRPLESYLCDPPPGYVRDNTDCDDSDPNTHPGAPELCDGKDNNCDGHIDSPAPSCGAGEACVNGGCCLARAGTSNQCAGATCGWNSQCASNACVNGKCCNRSNTGSERCEGQVCAANADCASGTCVDGLCCNKGSLANGRCSNVACNGTNSVCASGYCHDIRNAPGGNLYNDICLPSQCRQNINNSACLQYLNPLGASCNGSAGFETCASQYCVNKQCCSDAPGSTVPCRGRTCDKDADCPSGRCRRPSSGRPRVCQ